MLYINDDNTDDLFRRAADSYPLNTGTPDWQAMLGKLDAEQATPAAVGKTRPSFSKLVLLLLLLVPLEIIELEKTEVPATYTAGNNNGTGNNVYAGEHSRLNGDKEGPGTSTAGKPGILPSSATATTRSKRVAGFATPGSAGQPVMRKNILRTVADQNQPTGTAADQIRLGKTARENQMENTSPVSTPAFDTASKSPLAKMPPDAKTGVTVAGDSTLKEQASIAPVRITKRKNFYIGLAGGVDFSSIKLQQVRHAGHSAGIILGYRINKKFAIETGLLRDRKYYATSGDYFNPKVPVYTTVEYVNGYCNMWEIPVNLLYHFRQGKNSSWSVSAGTSTYLMRNESYLYDLNNNGVRYSHEFKYDQRSTNLLSVLNLGAVYSRRLGNVGELRLEPYLRLPLSRIGTGNMHVQSGGLMIGITRTIF